MRRWRGIRVRLVVEEGNEVPWRGWGWCVLGVALQTFFFGSGQGGMHLGKLISALEAKIGRIGCVCSVYSIE